LTENSESTLPKNYKPLPSGEADSERFRELTEWAHARIFSASGARTAIAQRFEKWIPSELKSNTDARKKNGASTPWPS